MTLRYLPPFTAVVGMVRMLTGQVRFNRDRLGEEIVMEEGQRHRVFREIRVHSKKGIRPGSEVTLTVRFRFARFSPRTNQVLSLIPVPVIAGMPGLLRKTWTYCDETGYSQGIYQFESNVLAQVYLRSPVVRVLIRRTAEGTFTWKIEDMDQGTLTPGAAGQEKEAASGTDP